tara:strand:+ start:51 stop:1007 length:957 start_codon:yes stop_codon:yes gene_type:complete
MAIKFGMTVADMILQLTKGFIKATGRRPDGLEKIKIKQEANQRFRDQQKVVDMEGRILDPSKTITGGTQEGAKSITLQDRKIKKAYDKAVSEGKFKGSEDQFRDKIDMMVDDIDSDFAIGGRVGFKKGMDRRTFMKLMGGITALPVIGKFFKGAEVAAPVAEKAVEAAKTVPPYFFDLVNKIKIFGKQRQTPSYKERVNEYTYTGKDGIEYELVEDLDTGEIIVKKDKMGVASSGDESYDVIEDRTEMVYKKGQADETTKGTPADEYDEYKVEFDQDGTAADATDVNEVSKMEIIKEVSADTPAIKKADGGIAMMLGQ